MTLDSQLESYSDSFWLPQLWSEGFWVVWGVCLLILSYHLFELTGSTFQGSASLIPHVWQPVLMLFSSSVDLS